MALYILRRMLLMVPTMLGIVILSFLILKLAPGDPSSALAGGASQAQAGRDTQRGTEDSYTRFRKAHKLNEPLPEQFLFFLQKLFTGKLQNYAQNKLIWDDFSKHLLVTVQINALVFFLIYVLAIPLGIFSAASPNTIPDRVSTVVLFVLYSLPAFWVAEILRMYLCGEGMLPSKNLHSNEYSSNMGMPVDDWLRFWRWHLYFSWGRFWDWVRHVTLPVICLTYGGLAYISRQMRAGMLEVVQQDYIRTARAKGASKSRVILVHGLRNGLFPVITLFASLLPMLVGGSVIIEYIFQIPGMGKYAYDAVLSREYDIVMATLMMSTMLTLLGILISDVMYVVVNPQVSFDDKQ